LNSVFNPKFTTKITEPIFIFRGPLPAPERQTYTDQGNSVIPLWSLQLTIRTSINTDTIEIGSLGHFTNSTSEAIVLTLPLEHIQSTNRTLQEAAKTAISCSQQIFLPHKQLEWNPSHHLI